MRKPAAATPDIPDAFKEYLETQMKVMVESVSQKFLETIGGQQEEQKKKERENREKLQKDLHKELQKEREARKALEEARKASDARNEKRLEEMQELMKEMKAKPSTSSSLPDPTTLPPTQSNNPWLNGASVYITEDGFGRIPNFGMRHLDDMDFYPGREYYPHTWVRVSDDVAEDYGKVVKEVVIYPNDRAQAAYRRFIRDGKAESTLKGVGKLTNSTYIAPNSMVFPFSSKVLKANFKNWRDKKDKKPELKEFEQVSLLVPNDSDDWKECDATFKADKLDKRVAQKQFEEPLPMIPEELLKKEFEARKVFLQALGTQSMAEFAMHSFPTKGVKVDKKAKLAGTDLAAEFFKLLSKSHCSEFSTALYNFGQARRACRKFVLKAATVRHEPERLINASLWGEFLFPESLVKEIKDRACKLDKSLMDKWGMRFVSKRKAFWESDRSSKRPRLSSHSPATNLKFEDDAHQNFRQGYNPRTASHRRGRGRRGGRRGNYRGGYRGGNRAGGFPRQGGASSDQSRAPQSAKSRRGKQ